MSLGNTRSPELSEVLSAAMNGHTDGLHFALPGKIEKYDSLLQKADVKPLLKRIIIGRDGSQYSEELPVIPEVPVCFPRGGGFLMTFPLAKGDLVLLVVCDRSIDSFVYSTGTIDTDPQDVRAHDLSDAVAIPCFYPFTRPIKCDVTQGAVFGSETGAQVRAKDSAIEVTSSGLPASIGGFVALATKVMTELTKIQTFLQTHTHTGVTVGTGSTGATTMLYTPSTVASTNLKAD